MRTHVRFITATTSLFVLLAAFGARADTLELRGRVPFAFMAGQKAFAPGICTIHRSDAAGGTLLVRNQQQAVFVLTLGASASGSPDRPRLVFHRYGSRYFLREIWLGRSRGRLLPETRQERDAAAATKMASLPSTVTVEVTLD